MANGIETLNEQRASPSAAQRLAYSVDHAAERIDVGRTKVWELIHDGRLQAVKIDGRTLITEAALNELLAQSPHAARTWPTTLTRHHQGGGQGVSCDGYARIADHLAPVQAVSIKGTTT